ncbi:hypothetical protein BDR07DRAFT_1378075 [Suillus spraguei]|nr:hypothetical protein BDR07DRAFT_1378075 [Suillus spraguei]
MAIGANIFLLGTADHDTEQTDSGDTTDVLIEFTGGLRRQNYWVTGTVVCNDSHEQDASAIGNLRRNLEFPSISCTRHWQGYMVRIQDDLEMPWTLPTWTCGRLDSGAKNGLLDVVNKVMGHALLDFKRAIYAGDDNTAIYVTRWARTHHNGIQLNSVKHQALERQLKTQSKSYQTR